MPIFVFPGWDDLPHVRLSVRLDSGDGGAPEEEVSHPQGHDGKYHTQKKLSISSVCLSRLLLSKCMIVDGANTVATE